MRSPSLLPVLFAFLSLASFSFAFFDQFFGQQQQQAPPRQMFSQLFESAPCETYLCGTLNCVAKPSDCPCPHSAQDVKCPLGNGEFLCARDCNAVKRAQKVL